MRFQSSVDVREKRFHALKKTWGVGNFLPISSFTDAGNGFLVDDCCVFGAEVLVIDNQTQMSTLSIVKKECDRSYTWNVWRRDLSGPLYLSSVFCFDGWSWCAQCSTSIFLNSTP